MWESLTFLIFKPVLQTEVLVTNNSKVYSVFKGSRRRLDRNIWSLLQTIAQKGARIPFAQKYFPVPVSDLRILAQGLKHISLGSKATCINGSIVSLVKE